MEEAPVDVIIQEDPIRENKMESSEEGTMLHRLHQEIDQQQIHDIKQKEIEERKRARRSKYFETKANAYQIQKDVKIVKHVFQKSEEKLEEPSKLKVEVVSPEIKKEVTLTVVKA
jgi:ATP phosphoribosyltransferase